MKTADGQVGYFKIQESQNVIIGRGEKCSVRIKDDYASSTHISLRIEAGFLIVKDLDSKNGTYINESYIFESHFYVGDILRIGDTSFQFATRKMSEAEVEHFSYKGKRKETEFMDMKRLKEEKTDYGSPVSLQLENEGKKSSAHFAEMRRKKKKSEIKKAAKRDKQEETTLGTIMRKLLGK
jgi:pSer/pThr/pTyr-binding forkhead associated (FHA) protein